MNILQHYASLQGFNLKERAKKHHRKNGKGRLFRTKTFYTGPAKDANQKTTVTKNMVIPENLHF